MLVRPFLTDARIDQNLFTSAFNEQTIHVHANAILLVRRRDLRPQIAGHDPERRATIESKLTVRNNLDAIFSELHRARKLFLSTFRCRCRFAFCGWRLRRRRTLRHHSRRQLLQLLRGWRLDRSEEHTSELQSLAYLVCL